MLLGHWARPGPGPRTRTPRLTHSAGDLTCRGAWYVPHTRGVGLIGRSDRVLRFRTLTADDQDKLWHWLHVALWDPPPAPLRPIEVLQAPGTRIYAEAWGRPSDVGVVAQVDGTDAGACWMRLLPAGQGLAYVDGGTPQLGIALEPEFQHKGYGRRLLLEALGAASRAGYRQVSLTVHPENPAQYLYASCGFSTIGLRGIYRLMVVALACHTGTPEP